MGVKIFKLADASTFEKIADKPNLGIMTISKSGNNYIVETKKDGKFVGTTKDGVLELFIKGQIIKALIDKNGNLIIGGNKAVRVE